LHVTQQTGVFVEFDQFINLGEKCQRLFQLIFTLAKKMREFYKIYPAWWRISETPTKILH